MAGAVMLGAPAGAQVSRPTPGAQVGDGAVRVNAPTVLRLKVEGPIESALSNCGGANQEALGRALGEAGAGDRVVFCSNGPSTLAAQLGQLKLLSAALAAKPDVLGDKKEQVLSALKRQIAELESQ